MSKHNFELKLKIVKDYLEGCGSAQQLGKEYGITDYYQITKWINQYRQFGEDGLKKKITKTYYSGEFKLGVLQYRKVNQSSYRETANYFNINNPAMIANWQRKYNEEGFQGLDRSIGRPSDMSNSEKDIVKKIITESEKEELIRLRKENEFLKASLEYEKKLEALVQERERKTKKRQKQ